MHPPLISILIPTYNQAGFIEQCINSVRSQRADFTIEILVGDDASTDSTAEVIQRITEIDHRVKLFRWPKNEKGLRNITRLLEKSQGKYIAILEGDDYWVNDDHLQLSINTFVKHPKVSFVCSNFHHLINNELKNNVIKPKKIKKIYFWHAALGNFIQMATIIFKRECYPAIPEPFMKMHTGDWPLLLSLLKKEQGLYLPHFSMAYRVHDAGIWSSQSLSIRVNKTLEDIPALIHSGFFTSQQKFLLELYFYYLRFFDLKLELGLKSFIVLRRLKWIISYIICRALLGYRFFWFLA
jgi:glycosyltransferase involved in cell wall biosynthesis